MLQSSVQWLWDHAGVFTTLSYPTATPENPDSFHDKSYYNTGRNDIFFIITCIAVMAILRDLLRLGVFEPLARSKLMRDLRRRCTVPAPKSNGASHTNGYANGNGHGPTKANGITNGNGHAGTTNGHAKPAYVTRKPTTKELREVHRSVLRFAEQGWSVVYYTFTWSYGLYVHHNLPTRIMDPSALWENYPHIPLAYPVKFYYLLQTAFYVHQVLILNAEARRKDHIQMMTHHFITVGLLVLSYFTNFTRVGCIIMLLMDWCDIFLPLAKMARYLAIGQWVTDALFAWFMVSWFVTRHVMFIMVIWSTMFDSHKYIPRVWAPERGLYLTQTAYVCFLSMLWALQALQGLWFWMICRVAFRVVTGAGAADTRSDEEVDDDDRKDS